MIPAREVVPVTEESGSMFRVKSVMCSPMASIEARSSVFARNDKLASSLRSRRNSVSPIAGNSLPCCKTISGGGGGKPTLGRKVGLTEGWYLPTPDLHDLPNKSRVLATVCCVAKRGLLLLITSAIHRPSRFDLDYLLRGPLCGYHIGPIATDGIRLRVPLYVSFHLVALTLVTPRNPSNLSVVLRFLSH